MVSKTEQARKDYKSGNFKALLKVTKDWRIGITKDERTQMSRGYECLIRPEFFKMIGKDPVVEIQKAVAIAKIKVIF